MPFTHFNSIATYLVLPEYPRYVLIIDLGSRYAVVHCEKGFDSRSNKQSEELTFKILGHNVMPHCQVCVSGDLGRGESKTWTCL